MYKSSIADEHFFFRLESQVFGLIFYTSFIPKISSNNIINNLFIFLLGYILYKEFCIILYL